jgi:hypothetical protein
MIRKIVYGLFALCLLVYLSLRAVYNPLVFDEATAMFLYIHPGDFLPWKAYWSANNHVLNSFLAWVLTSLFGSHPFVLRLPNLLAFALFAVYLFRLANLLSSRVLFWGLIGAAFGSHVFVEMFGYARGYGLSFAFMAGLIFYCIRYVADRKTEDLWFVYLTSALMLLANLNLLPLVVTAYAALLVVQISKKNSWKQIALHLILGLIPIGYALAMLFELKARNMLFYSTPDGFWKGSVHSLLEAFFGSAAMYRQVWFGLLIAALVPGIVALLMKQKHFWLSRESILAAFVLAVPTFYVVAHFIAGVDYPLSRSILFLPFLLFVALAFIFDRLEVKPHWGSVGVFIVVLPLLLRFASVMNLRNSTAFKWNTEQIPPEFFTAVVQREGATIGGYFLRQQVWDYYNFRSPLKTNRLQIEPFPNDVADFLVADTSTIASISEVYQIAMQDSASGLILFERSEKVKRELIETRKIERIEGPNEFSEFVHFVPDVSASYYLEVEGQLSSTDKSFMGIIAVSVVDSTEQSLKYVETRLANLYPDVTTKLSMKTGIYVTGMPEESAKLSLFFWNIEKQPVELLDVHVSLYQLREVVD